MLQRLVTPGGARASCIAALFAFISIGIAQAAAFPPPTVDPRAIGNPTPPAAPPKPFFARFDVTSGIQSAGPGNSKLVITSITLTNFNSTVQDVFVFTPVFPSGAKKCSDQATGGADPAMHILVQANSTITVPFPSGWVFHGFTPNCIAVQGQGSGVDASLVGYTQ